MKHVLHYPAAIALMSILGGCAASTNYTTDAEEPTATSASALTAPELGGMDFNRYCSQVYGGGSYAALRQANAWGWVCTDGSTDHGIEVHSLCRSQYNETSWGEYKDFNNAYSWTCVGQKGAYYTIKLANFRITKTRALRNDTDIVGLGLKVGDKEFDPIVRDFGDVNDGVHAVGLGYENVFVPDGGSASFAYTIMNSGYNRNHEGDAKTVLNTVTSGIGTILGKVYPQFQSVWTGVNTGLGGLHDIMFANCDGLVAGDVLQLDSDALRYWADSPDGEERFYPGTDSAWGCGQNSRYFVTTYIYHGSNPNRPAPL